MDRIVWLFYLPVMLCSSCCFAQKLPSFPVPGPKSMQVPILNETPQKTTGTPPQNLPSSLYPDLNKQAQQNQNLMNEAERDILLQNQMKKEVQADIESLHSEIRYSLPSWSKTPGTEFYGEAFDKIILLDTTFSIKDTNFLVENAYYENMLNKSEFDNVVKQSGTFLTTKMKELGYDLDSNAAKNFMLFQFFSETLQLKSTKQKHLPFKYDFEDYTGADSYSKLFVSKLIETGSGQCHSLPLLYLILAEEINAEAYLALSPNHNYIRFPDDKGKWYNIELTNGMFSTTSYILQSGYIKSEALQNKIYMENLSRKELLAQHLTDLAGGYVHKYGYDEFVQRIVDKALELYPNSITANMIKANLDTARFEFVMRQLGINPADKQELQNIRNFPKAIELLNTVNGQYAFIDNLGYEHMPEEAYKKWLESMADEKQKQDNETISQQFKGILAQPSKTLKN